MAQGTFYFGTLLDLGWIIGYLLLALATFTPLEHEREVRGKDPLRESVADALGTTLVFSVLVVATVVQVLFGGQGSLQGAQAALWVLIVVAAGVRQTILTADNHALRRGLERRVEDQTADLRRLARQNEVLVTSVGDGVYGVDHQGRVTFVNPSAVAMLGYDADDLQGLRAHEVFHAPDADGSPFPWSRCYIYEAITHGLVASAEEDDYIRADGTVVPRRDHRRAPARRGRGPRRGRGLPRRDPASRGGPDEGRVPLRGQPRAAHAAHLDPRLAGAARRRPVGELPERRRRWCGWRCRTPSG